LEQYLPILQNCSLFYGVTKTNIPPLLKAYHATTKHYGEGETVLWAGSTLNSIGIVVSGALRAEKLLRNGNRSLFATLGEGDIFGDILAGSSNQSPVTLTASTPATVLYIPHDYLLKPENMQSEYHPIVLHNLVTTISNKYFAQNKRLELVTMQSLTEKVTAYLLSESERHNSKTFTIPLNREQLAVYLNCERSALSRTLSQMKHAGLINYTKNKFTLIDANKLL